MPAAQAVERGFIGRGLSTLGGMINSVGSALIDFPDFIWRTLSGAVLTCFYLILITFAIGLVLDLFPVVATAVATAYTTMPIVMTAIPGILASILAIRDTQSNTNRQSIIRAAQQGNHPQPIDEDEVNYRVLGATATLLCSAAFMPAFASLRMMGTFPHLFQTSLLASAGVQLGSAAREAIYPRATA